MTDRGEPESLMEPMRIGSDSAHYAGIVDLAVELAADSAAFSSSLPDGIRTALANLVRAMNCYYSNLIEGHDTHPVDIERALNQDYSRDPERRSLQLEATAHISVQRWIDGGGVADPYTVNTVREIHRRFTDELPDELRWVRGADGKPREPVLPGALRTGDVQVGQHVPVSAGAVPRFLMRFEQAYRGLGRTEAILAAAAAHHRLLWIHPFVDGNGRVARLMSHAALLKELETGGIWSVARGFARSVATYKGHLNDCDLPRRNDIDGRGNLSEEALAKFTRYFLETCIDQVRFMRELVRPRRLRERITIWAEEETRGDALPPHSVSLLNAVLLQGELRRGEVAGLLGVTARHAQRITGALAARGVLESSGPRAPWTLAFPAELASRWLPGLFPDR